MCFSGEARRDQDTRQGGMVRLIYLIHVHPHPNMVVERRRQLQMSGIVGRSRQIGKMPSTQHIITNGTGGREDGRQAVLHHRSQEEAAPTEGKRGILGEHRKSLGDQCQAVYQHTAAGGEKVLA